jgi:Second Messenger Oligonucleotide or Dinucleotide Synthetase domain
MAKTAAEGFSTFLSRLTPSKTERDKASKHRASIEIKLNAKFGLHRMFESGSFRHGTGVSGESDVDLFASLKSSRPLRGSSSLATVRNTLKERFPATPVYVRSPAVVIDFGSGYERVEVIPAYALGPAGEHMKYNIPGVTSDWMQSTPEAHLAYVNESNTKPSKGHAKSMARLIKAWKYYRDVPISSFYLEMRAAAYTRRQSTVVYWMDLYLMLAELQQHGLASMNDPAGTTGRIEPCSSAALKQDAISKLDRAVARAGKAYDAAYNGNLKTAFEQWDLLFAGQFPSYY